jgi:hypothetical protein
MVRLSFPQSGEDPVRSVALIRTERYKFGKHFRSY